MLSLSGTDDREKNSDQIFYYLLEAQNFKWFSFRQWSVLEQSEIKLDKLKELSICTPINVEKSLLLFFTFLVISNKQMDSKRFIIVSNTNI